MDQQTLQNMTRKQLLVWAIGAARKLEELEVPDLLDPTQLANEEEEPDEENDDDAPCHDDDDATGVTADVV